MTSDDMTKPAPAQAFLSEYANLADRHAALLAEVDDMRSWREEVDERLDMLEEHVGDLLFLSAEVLPLIADPDAIDKDTQI